MKKIFSFLFIAVIFSFLFARPSFALLEGFNSGCLVDPNFSSGHEATLSIQKGNAVPALDTKTWIFVCITKGQETYCTTGGDGSMDVELFGSNQQYQKLVGIAEEVGGVKAGSNPSATNNDAANPQFKETIKWGDVYLPSVVHQWSWVQAAIPTDAAGGAGDAGAQQQASLIFERVSDETKKCAKISWDPRGVVFDSNTFLPVKNVVVELSRKRGTTYEVVPNQLGLTNPYTTNSTNGQYSFFVDEGWYKLKLKNGVTISSLTPAQQITADNFFTDSAGKNNIYTEDLEIFEKAGTVAIAHIPVNVIDTTTLVKDLSILDNVSPTLEGDSIRLFGRVSHPRSKMIITMNMVNESLEQKQFVKLDYTDGLGEYDKLISQTVESDEPLIFEGATLSFELNSYYTTGIFARKDNKNAILQFVQGIMNSILNKLEANAVTTSNSIQIKPIPSYIEGIAYDLKGIAIPKAIVGVYPFFSEKPFYLTIADENGRYKIGAQHLPQFEYKIRYKKPTGEVVIIDTSTFVKQNAKLILEENINPFTAKKTTVSEDKVVEAYFASINTPVELKSPEEKQRAIEQSKNSQLKNTVGKNNASTSNINSSSRDLTGGPTSAQAPKGTLGAGMQGIVMIVVVLIILIMVGVGAFIMMKSKQQSSNQY